MTFSLPDLPYAYDSLAPYMSKETLEFPHQNGFQLVKSTPAFVHTIKKESQRVVTPTPACRSTNKPPPKPAPRLRLVGKTPCRLGRTSLGSPAIGPPL